MNLPFILDIVIGLTFIYLILSLLAAEIQEFLTTIFQWRAKHLKEAIEILMAGGKTDSSKTEIQQAIQLADQLYQNPLLENINQSAKGWLENIPRRVIWTTGDFYRWLKRRTINFYSRIIGWQTHGKDVKFLSKESQRTVFGDSKRSAPSYIPSETFATTLMETLQIPIIVHKLIELKLNEFIKELSNQIKCLLSKDLPSAIKEKDPFDKYSSYDEIELKGVFGESEGILISRYYQLQRDYEEYFNDFKNDKATIETTIERMEKRLSQHTTIAVSDLKDSPEKQYLINQMELLKTSYFGENESGRNVVLRRIKPSLTQVIDEIDKNRDVFKEILTEIQNQDQEKHRTITVTIDNLPKSLKDSIYTLAHRAQSRVEIVETDINQLRQEIELWFDRSMERASGVYKRNAKGVAFLIGLCIAFAVNADTFHIASRLSTDTTVRNAIIQSANQVTSKCTSSQPECIKKISQSLDTVSLPIGWSQANLEQQKEREFKFKERRIPFLVQISGWMLTGIAIAMGAPFWFELLGKFVNVRNAGSKPSSLTDEPAKTEARKDSVSRR